MSDLYDVLGVRLEVGQRVLYATSWRQYAALHIGTLVALSPSLVVRPERNGSPLVRPAQALAVISERGFVLGAEADAWLRRRLGEIEER